VPSGLKWHPDGEHLIYPLGSSVIIKNIVTGAQTFLSGHTSDVTCVALSRCGRYIASGQRTEMGNKVRPARRAGGTGRGRARAHTRKGESAPRANPPDSSLPTSSSIPTRALALSPLSPSPPQCPILLWDFDAGVANAGTDRHDGELLHKLVLHKVAIQSLSFSYDSAFLASLGGQDDNTLVIWDLASGKAICGTPAASYAALSVQWSHGSTASLVTCGQYHVRKWEFNFDRRRLFPEDLKTGGVKRIFTTLAVAPDDRIAYAGTSTGDVIMFSLETGNFLTTSSHRFSLGVCSLAVVDDGSVLVGTGDGALVKINAKDLKVIKAAELLGGVTSIAVAPDQQTAFVGTEGGNIYGVATAGLESKLRGTAHSSPIVDVVFPAGTSELFLTAAGCEIRIWHSVKRTELLRIQVPALKVNCIAINSTGTSIVSGWDDGKIRAFTPETGKLQYAIHDAHAEAVTAIAFTHDGKRIVSGGRDGRVRTWNVSGRSQVMELSFKEHKKEVTSVRISKNDEEAITASADGSCLMWNLRRGVRANALFASTVFRTMLYHPDESQLLTCGSDRKITYWDTTDCTAIRVMDGSTEEVRFFFWGGGGGGGGESRHSSLCVCPVARSARARSLTTASSASSPPSHDAQINSIDIERDGVYFASGGADRQVKVWLYDEGEQVAAGVGHSGTITRLRISPDKRIIVSVGSEGAIFIWHMFSP
jgi:cilia- and flagella-associated protein 52